MLNDDGLRKRSGKPWNISTITYMLKNETYTGTVIWRDHKNINQIIKTPNAHEAIISNETLARAKSLLIKRTRFTAPPRALASDHLLSSMLLCKRCGSSMAACGAKSGQYHYYTCQSYVKMGRKHCNQKLLRADKLEAFIVKTLQERVLTEENIKDLLLQVNEKLRLFSTDSGQQILTLKGSIEDKQEKHRNLYQVIEKGQLDFSDVAPRLKELNEEIETMTAKIQEIEFKQTQTQSIQITDVELRPYVLDLQETLVKGSIIQRKSFIRTFVKQIAIDYPNVDLEYTIPLPVPNKETPSSEEVLSLQQFGSPNRI